MAGKVHHLEIKSDEPCPLCHNGGSVNGGLCLECAAMLSQFTNAEQSLIKRNIAIFNHPDADPCPICNREKSPMVAYIGGPCLLCIEEKLKANKAVLLKHLPERWPGDAHTFQLAHELIEKYHVAARSAAVAYLFKAKHTEPNGKIQLGSCSKQSAKSKMLHGWDYIIEIAWDMWALFTDAQREALLLHEIRHIQKAGTDWKIEPHSVEEHTQVIEVYGLWKPDLQAFAAAIRDAEEIDPNQPPLGKDF